MGSINRALLEAAQELAPHHMTIQIFDLTPIPMYNSELDTDERRPQVVNEFKQAIAAADGMLIATPEYNYSIPGVLKNALDWASRPGNSPLKMKPTASWVPPAGCGAPCARRHTCATSSLRPGRLWCSSRKCWSPTLTRSLTNSAG